MIGAFECSYPHYIKVLAYVEFIKSKGLTYYSNTMICKEGPGIHLSLYLFLFTIYCIILCVSCTSSSLSNVFWNPPTKVQSEIGTRIKRASVSVARISLIHNPKCRDDLKRLCTSLNINSDDLSVLECIETAKVGHVTNTI